MVNNIFVDKCYEYLRTIRHVIGYHKSLLLEFKNYGTLINDMGLIACNDSVIKATMKSNAVMYYDVPGGVNMSFKSRLINEFRLPGVTTRGINYEKLLMLHYLTNHKLHTAIFKGGNVIHLERDSLGT